MQACEELSAGTHSSIDALINRARSGESDAYGELLKRHAALVCRTAYSFVHNNEDVEDIYQEVSLCVFRKLHTFQGASTFSTWLTRIAINASLQRLRQTRRKPVTSFEDLTDDESSFLPLADSAWDPEQLCLDGEQRAQLSRAISRLPPSLQNIACDYVYEQLPILQIAERRGLSLAATKSRAYRARQRLMAILGQQKSTVGHRTSQAHRGGHTWTPIQIVIIGNDEDGHQSTRPQQTSRHIRLNIA
ncbi:MAG: sigma-70 family RNA polymerase sigma factor [Acidobacteriaceae bacterium]|nr:sigma-70 family RNA polymerase sigma factor [Acidobacteriaceae bacterium]